ncbi:hypothetical protein [Thauera sinica]|uniref:Uncharacterized protein n=1 Tax=Thauera sinica TaxID=2665146 RepID=A0ABW1AQ12_9RHOO|nr:hypothetical protein [Thauera sp. K11]
MDLTSRGHLRRPRLLIACILILGLLGCFTLSNAVLYAHSSGDFLYASMPMLLTTVIYMHRRYPTKLGWFAIAFLLLAPSIAGTIGGLTSIYFDIGTKYGWGMLIDVLLIDLAIFLVIACLLHAASITDAARP